MVAKRRWLGGIATAFAIVALWLCASDTACGVNAEMVREVRGRATRLAPLVVLASEPGEIGAVESAADASSVTTRRVTVRVVDESGRALSGVLGSLELWHGPSRVRLEDESASEGVLRFTVASSDDVMPFALLSMRSPRRLAHCEEIRVSGDLTIERTLSIGAAVRVIDGAGEPVAGAMVMAYSFRQHLQQSMMRGLGYPPLITNVADIRYVEDPPDKRDWGWSSTAFTDEHGRVLVPFAVDDLYFTATLSYAASGTRAVTAAERAHGFTIELDAVPIRGVVVDDLGRPVAGARVGGIGAGIATTGSDGVFVLSCATPGKSLVAVSHENYTSTVYQIDSNRKNMRIVLDRGATLYVDFVNESHNPVDLRERPDLEVILTRFGGGGRERRIAPTMGSECVIHGLSPGLHHLSLRYDWLDGKKTLCSTMIDVSVGATDHTLVVP